MRTQLRRTLLLRPLEDRTAPAVFTVLNLNDSGADSLRDCVSKANALDGADTINFKAGLSGTIMLTSGELAISGSTVGTVTINGPGAAVLSVNANKTSRIFNTSPAPLLSKITISGLTLTGGSAATGGAILVGDENCVLTNCAFSGNLAFNKGGAILLGGGGLTATNCSFTNNIAGTLGGAIAMTPAGTTGIILRSCTISGNEAPTAGGIYANNYLLVEHSTIAANSATALLGGGLLAAGNFQSGGLTIRNSTISGNSAFGDGGGVALNSGAMLTVQNCTVTNNTSVGAGGGIARPGGGGFITLESSIISGNIGANGPDIFNNNSDVIQKTSAVGSSVGFFQVDQGGNLPFGPHIALHLAPLANNGGSMLTHALGPTSPLRDAGSNPAGLTNDQRGAGFARVVGAQPDIGATEAPNFISLVVTNAADAGPGSLRQAVLDANKAQGVDLITFDPITFGSEQTIALTSGEIAINESVTIIGPDLKVTIDGKAASRLFNLSGAVGASDIVLQNVILTNGKTTSGNGGGVLVADQALTLQFCSVTNCTALAGGAVAVGTGSLLIEDSEFTGNQAKDGGAIQSETSPRVTLRRSTLADNTATNQGGAVDFADNGAPVIEDCTFAGNTASGTGGAIHAAGSSNVTVRRSILADNVTGKSSPEFDGGGAIRSANLLVEDSTLSGNKCLGSDPGGAISAPTSATVTIRRSTLVGNTASFGGGAIFATKLVIEDSKLTGNFAGIGGAIYVQPPQSSVTIRRTTLSGNTSASTGGAINNNILLSNSSSLVIEDSTLSGNSAKGSFADQGGGAVYFFGQVSNAAAITFRNCTFSGNVAPAGSGGAVLLSNFFGTATFQNCTLTGNSVGSFGGGIARNEGSGTLLISSCIIAANSSTFGPDIVTFGGPNVAGNNNLIGVGNEGFVLTGTGNLTGTKASPLNAKLGPLVNNGGPTFTHIPLPGSPALNAGNNAAGLTFDQRGFTRVIGAAADIGAFEVQPVAKVSGVIVNDGSAQRSRVTSLTVLFDQPPDYFGSPSTAFQLQRQSDNAIVTMSAVSIGIAVTLNFTGGPMEAGSLADGRYTLTVNAAQINNLDGDGNGKVGGSYVLVGTPTNGLFRLFADGDGDGDVDTGDFAAFRAVFGGTGNVWDFDNDGDVDTSDFGSFRARFGLTA